MTWVFLDDHANEDERRIEAGIAASAWHDYAHCYCRRRQEAREKAGEPVDRFPVKVALTLFPDPKGRAYAKALLRVGLWRQEGDSYVLVDWAERYGQKGTGPPSPAEPSRLDQPNQPTPSQLGGKARASRASRGPAGRFQPKHQPAGPAEPAPRASGSGSGTGSGSILASNPLPKDLSVSARNAATEEDEDAVTSHLVCPKPSEIVAWLGEQFFSGCEMAGARRDVAEQVVTRIAGKLCAEQKRWPAERLTNYLRVAVMNDRGKTPAPGSEHEQALARTSRDPKHDALAAKIASLPKR